ncbi:MAG: hypothetical protein ACXW2U_16265 [Telluria sp.]
MLAVVAALGGCATISEPDQQVVLVQTIQDNREIAGIGCILTNDAGRWFVTSPGRVSVRKSAGKLWVDCKKTGMGVGQDVVDSRANTSALVGNAVLTAGLGYLVDKRTGIGFDYPDTLTVLMRRTDSGYAEPVAQVAEMNALY